MTIFDRLVRFIARMDAKYERRDGEPDDERWRADRDSWRQVKYLSYALAAILVLALLKYL